jgi:hypothetical protein
MNIFNRNDQHRNSSSSNNGNGISNESSRSRNTPDRPQFISRHQSLPVPSSSASAASDSNLHYQFLNPNLPSLSASLTSSLGNEFGRLHIDNTTSSKSVIPTPTAKRSSTVGIISQSTSFPNSSLQNYSNDDNIGNYSSSSNQMHNPATSMANTIPNSSNNNNNNCRTGDNVTSIIHDAARVTDWISVNNLAQSHPESAAYKCPDGLTPIHHACSRRCPYPSVFHNLIQAYPNALTQIDEKGFTPLHYACRFKAPKEGVRLLLHLYKEKGCYAARLRCREKGRTPLFYAIRYDAPDGVVELLLNCMNKVDILDGDRDGQSAIGLVWDQYVNSMEGKRVMMFYSKTLKKWEEENIPFEDRVEHARKLRENLKGKLKSCWEKANMLLRGAFRFPLKDDDDCDNQNHDDVFTDIEKNEDGQDHQDDIHQHSKQRKWRVLHAAVSTRCHSTLALMACVLHPEQVREIDDQDLFGAHTNDRFTALHFAAKSPMSGKDSRLVIAQLLEMYPDAASIPNPADNSFPLHYLCENTSKVHWLKDIKPVYNAYPQAVLAQDCNGRTPLHRATTMCEARDVPLPPNCTPTSSSVSIRSIESVPSMATSLRSVASSVDPAGSIIQNIVALHSQVASIQDVYGKLPFHYVAEFGENWDANVQCLHDAYPTALSTRTNAQSGNNLPIHLAASNPDARFSLISKIVELHPRGVSLGNRKGKLPLHLACESGKDWGGGFECIYNAYPNAINIPEDNERRWLPLHFIVACPDSSLELIEMVMKLNPYAANRLDGNNKTVLHLAVESGKDWNGGIELLFGANPEAIQVEDTSGKIPLVSALLTYCHGKNNNNEESASPELGESDKLDDTIAQVDDDELIGPHLAQVNVLYHLLKAAPHVLNR